MTPPTTEPSALVWRLWRWMSPISGVLLWLCIAFWVLALGLFTLMHVLILPRIDAIRPAMERQVGAILGLEVHIGTLEAHTAGMEYLMAVPSDAPGADYVVCGCSTVSAGRKLRASADKLPPYRQSE